MKEFFDSTANYLSGVQAILYEDGEQIACLKERKRDDWIPYFEDSVFIQRISYQADYIPKPGKNYRIEASHPDYDPIWAETQFPTKGAFSTSRLGVNSVDQFGNIYSSMVVKLETDGLAYVGVEGILEKVDTTNSPAVLQAAMFFETRLNEPKIAVRNRLFWISTNSEENQIFFRSRDLNLRTEDIDRIYLSYVFYDSAFHSYQVEFGEHQRATLGGNNTLFPKEASELPSNVRGGYGIFGSYLVVKDTL